MGMTREICKRCHRENPVGYVVDDEMWEAVRPAGVNVLCIMCFAELADEKLLHWDDNIQLFPVSRAFVELGELLQEGRRIEKDGDDAGV